MRSLVLSVSNNLEFSRWHKFSIRLSSCYLSEKIALKSRKAANPVDDPL